MATTAKGTPYVESSDLVADYPSVSLALAEHIDDFGGKVLQVVRATDTTDRSTTSTSFVDANLSVTITPQRSTSAVILIVALRTEANGSNAYMGLQITDNSNNAISGAQNFQIGTNALNTANATTIIGYATPATTSAVTYKLRFKRDVGQAIIYNSLTTGQMYAIEVSA
jgi:hypothetical protein